MANTNYKQYRKNRIKEQLKAQKVNKMSKTLADQYMNMTDEDWQEFAKALHEEMEQAKETKEEGAVK
ncbi:MAG: hypothetical protein ACLUSV_00670 [Streptococcus sp.]